MQTEQPKRRVKENRAKIKIAAIVSAALALNGGCALQHNGPQAGEPFNLVHCLEKIPDQVEGLEILAGRRDSRSIRRDMTSIACAGQQFYAQQERVEKPLPAGSLLLKVTVEYTGEVVRVETLASSLPSKVLEKRLVEMTLNHDFAGWDRSDEDSVFIYPFRFGRE